VTYFEGIHLARLEGVEIERAILTAFSFAGLSRNENLADAQIN